MIHKRKPLVFVRPADNHGYRGWQHDSEWCVDHYGHNGAWQSTNFMPNKKAAQKRAAWLRKRLAGKS
jgi:hypothetical protein